MHITQQNFLTYLSEKLSLNSSIDKTTVMRALVLLRQGHVQNVIFKAPILQGYVTDIKTFHITLDLISPARSECTCHGGEFCVHKLALFLNYFNEFPNVNIWLTEWKNKQDMALTHTGKYTEPLALNYEEWAHFFKTKLTELLPNCHSIHNFTLKQSLSLYEEMIKIHEPVEYEWAMLFKSIAYFSTLKHIWTFTENEFTEELNQYVLTRFKLAFNQYSQSPIFFQADEFHLSLLSDTRCATFLDSSFLDSKWQTYRHIWSPRLSTFKQRADEISYLKDCRDNEFCIWAATHLHLTNKEDLEALNTLKSTNITHIEFILVITEDFIAKKEFNRSFPIIEWLIKGCTASLRKLFSNILSIRIFSNHIRTITQELNRSDLLEKFYKDNLPYTAKDYLLFLYSQKNYSKWLELLFISQQENLSFYYEEIRRIEDSFPKLTLPFYHREIQLLITQKERNSYKQAVRLLIHLKGLYKSSNRENEWNLFLNQLIKKNRRLRAFLDELKRSNLYVSSIE